MTLIGFRNDEMGNIYFLFQNWWKNKQFIEVNVEYFKNCSAIAYFIETPQNNISYTYALSYGKYGETTNFEMKDSYELEKRKFVNK